MPEDFTPLDWHRMFVGDLPLTFLIEICLRTLIIYAYALLLIRWIGGRGVGQMSTVEFLLVVALGSAVGDAMFYPDVPILHAMLVITLVVGINKLIDIGMLASPRIRRIFAGRTVTLVAQGRIILPALRHAKVSRGELFEGLRENGIRNLGRVDHAFLETGGQFSVFRRSGPVAGLPIVPLAAEDGPDGEGHRLCAACAALLAPEVEACPHCGSRRLGRATMDEDHG